MIDLSHVRFTAVAPTAPARGVRRLHAGISTAPSTAQPQNPGVPLDPFLAWLLESAGLNVSAYRTAPLERRLPACLRHLRVKTTAEARTLLAGKPHLQASALNTALIGVTSFFRDEAVFSVLRQSIVPRLLRSRRGLRVLSAGCSGGHELYSVAMVLAEAGVLEHSFLLGIDCRPAAVARARLGRFEAAEVASLDTELRARYLHKTGATFTIKPRLMSKTAWQTCDLMSFASDRPFDLVLFRNVAIYLETSHAASALARMAAHLTEDGCLITGKAEIPPACIPVDRVATCIYRNSQPRLVA